MNDRDDFGELVGKFES